MDKFLGMSAKFWFWMWMAQVFIAPLFKDYIRGFLIGLGYGD